MTEKRSLKSEKGKKMYSRIGDGRQQGQETDERIGVPSPPTRRFASFTPLVAPIDQVLMQIKEEASLTWAGNLKGDSSKRSRDKY